MKEESGEKEKTLDIYPIGKWKRILLSLSDAFLCFIFAVFLFSAAVLPISRKVTNYDSLASDIDDKSQQRIQVLIDNNVLLKDGKGDFSSEVSYTAKMFTIYHLGEANKTDNVFWNYFSTRSDLDLVSLYRSYDFKPSDNSTTWLFFSETLNVDGLPCFNSKYLADFKPLSNEKDELSSSAQSEYDSFVSSFFMPFYQKMINEIKTYDYENKTPLAAYQTLDDLIEADKKSLNQNVSFCGLIAYAFSWLVCFLIVPFLNHAGGTPSCIMLRKVRVGADSFLELPLGERAIISIYPLISGLSLSVLIPCLNFSFATLFTFADLLLFSILGAAFALISLIFLIFSPFNQTLEDRLSKSILIAYDDFELICQTKNHIV